jgi:hypothetical protein
MQSKKRQKSEKALAEERKTAELRKSNCPFNVRAKGTGNTSR